VRTFEYVKKGGIAGLAKQLSAFKKEPCSTELEGAINMCEEDDEIWTLNALF
jgi:hypothetical protein